MTLCAWEGMELVDFTPASEEAGEVTVRLPSIEELADRWFVIGPLLERATRRTGCYLPSDLLALAMAGRAAIWVCEIDGVIEAAVATQVQQYPRRRIYEVLFGGGNQMRRWIKPLVAAIDEHARQLQCDHVACSGRRGWVRAWGAELTGDVVLIRAI